MLFRSVPLCTSPGTSPFPLSAGSETQRGVLIAKEVKDDGRVSVLKDARVEIWQVTGGTNWAGNHGGRLEISMGKK